jgi:flagellar basal-body rod protein FlgF
MATGMWTSVSGAVAQAQNVDIVANNLANSETLGFKKDLPTFKEYLAATEREDGQIDIPRIPVKDKDFYPIDGRDQSYVVMDGTYTNFRQGNLKVTQAPLDVAMDGPGFLEVSTPNGIRYTRQGSLKMAMDGRLVTPEGYPVLAAQPGGLAAALPATPTVQPPDQGRSTLGQALPGSANNTTQGGVGAGQTEAARFVNLRDRGTNIVVNHAGEIYAGEDLVARLSVVEFTDPNKLRKVGGQLFENKDQANAVNPTKTVVRQGVLETSNVNPIEEMTNLIKANRLFEHDLKAMKTYGDLMGKEANDIGKL